MNVNHISFKFENTKCSITTYGQISDHFDDCKAHMNTLKNIECDSNCFFTKETRYTRKCGQRKKANLHYNAHLPTFVGHI